MVSRHIKQYLRQNKPLEHWHIGVSDLTIDCFMALTKRINISPESFFCQLNTKIQHLTHLKSKYAEKWHQYKNIAKEKHNTYLSNLAWSDLKAFEVIFQNTPKNWNIQISNGTSIRYSQLFDTTVFNRVDCNRGVSGIDGCSSTAIGASLVYDGTTLLITGDMSAQYDVSALSSPVISPKFKDLSTLCITQ